MQLSKLIATYRSVNRKEVWERGEILALYVDVTTGFFRNWSLIFLVSNDATLLIVVDVSSTEML